MPQLNRPLSLRANTRLQSDTASRRKISPILKHNFGANTVPIYRGGAADAQSVSPLRVAPIIALTILLIRFPQFGVTGAVAAHKAMKGDVSVNRMTNGLSTA
jgi:hypothetical protein